MLVTFRTPAYASITMFGDVAVTLLKLMGHSGTVPGAIMAADIPAALQRLRKAVEAHAEEPLGPVSETQATPARATEEGQYVSLANRALPLIELLNAAAADQENVLWD
ncbi:hypothetical protein CKO25_09035 [Thiocapsa imhoffii]|uniref:DUF1840 domain-containing protein n=1 Tax=Thiocapsa imhoffii TaxID=382777 RepID=A0A9X0WHS3_9GAMM|nr:DUF1840 domain-containing protein [Thiocapsa imhoffii]MBK1644790.1 hypothetical protein [Thiocapsa imhoffii]